MPSVYCREVQRAQLKLAEEERHKIAMDLKDRLQAIDKLKAKYDVLAGRMRGSSEDGEERSQAYFIIQAAQKREELQREGDELVSKLGFPGPIRPGTDMCVCHAWTGRGHSSNGEGNQGPC